MDPSAEIEKILIFALDGRPTRAVCSKADKKVREEWVREIQGLRKKRTLRKTHSFKIQRQQVRIIVDSK